MQELHNHKTTSCFSHSFVILFIPFIFILGLILASLGIFSVNVESHTLFIVGFIFVVFIFFVKHNSNYVICQMRNSFFGMEEELQIALTENALTIMGKTKSTLHIKEFMAEYYQDIRNDDFARVAPSVFPMLGILGTFIAIALSMPDFTVKDTTSLDHEISVLLSGIGTAFYASIYGIMLSLIWTYFEKRGMAKIDTQRFHLEKLYGKRVWKEFELLKHQHMQNELKDHQIIETLRDTFNMTFIKELNDEYLKNFTSVMNQTTKNFTILTTNMQESSLQLQNTLDKIQSRQKSIDAVDFMEQNIAGFNETSKNLQKSMERFDGTVEHTFDSIDKELGEAIDKLASFAQNISEQNQLVLKNMITLTQQDK